MQLKHKDEHNHIASFVLPSRAVAACHHPFYMNPDALNFAMLDCLVNFTGKVHQQRAYRIEMLAILCAVTVLLPLHMMLMLHEIVTCMYLSYDL